MVYREGLGYFGLDTLETLKGDLMPFALPEREALSYIKDVMFVGTREEITLEFFNGYNQWGTINEALISTLSIFYSTNFYEHNETLQKQEP